MTNIRIIGLWFATILLGSLFLSLISILYNGRMNEDLVGLTAMFMLFSFLFSIPAIIAFLLFNNYYTDISSKRSQYNNKMYLMNTVVSFFYLIVGLLYSFSISYDGWPVVLLFFCYYPIGMLLWYMQLRKTS